jgi:nitrate/nitrite transport system substrate-binding protein
MGKRISRREFIKRTSLLAGATLAGGSFFESTAFAIVKPVKIGVLPPSHCALSMVHAHLTGTFKKNGINAEIVYVPDMKDIAQGLIRKELDAGQLITSSFLALNAGVGPFAGNAVPVVTAQFGGTNGGTVVVRNDSQIKGPQDLVGKKIGIHNPLTVQLLIVKALLKKYNIDPVKDIQTKIMPMSELVGALRRGEIDCFINPEPLATIAKASGAGKDMMLTARIWYKHPCCLVTMRRDLYEKNQDMARSLYLSTLQSGIELNNGASRHGALEKIHRESAPYNKIALASLKSAFAVDRSDFDPFPYQSSATVMLGMMMESGVLPQGTNIGKMVSDCFLSDFSRSLHTALGQTAPKENIRQEKIASILQTPV